jgi:hypothetical protein
LSGEPIRTITATVNDGTHEWERQEGEPLAAWNAFRAYRDLPPGKARSVKRAAEALSMQESGFRRWSKKWRWPARSEAWDAHLDAAGVSAIEFERTEAAKRRIKLADSILRVAEHQLQTWIDDIECGIKIELTPYEVAKLIEIGYKIDRLERGESTDNMAVNMDARLTDMTQEQLMERAKCILEGMLEKQLMKR